jgi:tetratricopeptide (TPR) repeat protein
MRRLLALILVLALGLGTSTANAQPAPTATQHFEAGRKAYDQEDYARAADEWQKAYDLGKDPSYLFNIGQAHRQALQWERALAAYEQYLAESPKAKNRRLVLKRIREAKREIAARPPAPPAPPEPAPAPPPVVAEPTPEPEPAPAPPYVVTGADMPRPGRKLQLAGLVTGGAGLALVITGVVLGISASGAREDLEDAAREGAVWGPEYEDLDAKRKRNTALSAVSLTLGIGAIATGGILFFLGTRQNHRAVEVMPTVEPAGARVTLRVRF